MVAKLKNGEAVLVTAENNGTFEGFLLDSRGRVKLMYPSEDDFLPCDPVPMCWSFTRQDLLTEMEGEYNSKLKTRYV